MKRSNIWFAVILILSVSVLGAPGSRGDEKHQHQANEHPHASRSQSKQATLAFTIIVQPAPVTIVQPSAPIEQEQPAKKWYERPTITDWGILVVTVLYVLIALGLFRATRRQAELTKEALTTNRRPFIFASGLFPQYMRTMKVPKLATQDTVAQYG